MPVQNDLTPEEEREFVEHGVQPAGPGGEPIQEGLEEAPEGSGEDGEFTQADLNQEHAQRNEPAPGEVGSRRHADGTFKNKDELAADQATLAAQGQQGQQQQPQGQQQEQSQQQPQMVPLAALHEARQRAAQAAQMAQLATTRMNAMLAAQQGQGQQPPTMPDLAENPAAYIQALEQRLSQFETVRQEETQSRQIESSLEQDELIFSQQVPDYDAASEYYVQSRARELLQFHTPQDAQQILRQEAHAIATQSWQRGMSAAQAVYSLAQARGYAPGQQQQGQVVPFQPQGQQQQRGPTAQAQVRAVQQGQQRSRSLSGGGGAPSTEVLNAEALLAMSDEEFEQALALGSKGAEARFRQALG